MYVVDASVHVSDFRRDDPHHASSSRLFQALAARVLPVLCPEILLPEVASAVFRGTGDSALAQRLVHSLRRIPHYRFIPVDAGLADLAADLAARYGIRGCDAIYVAIAHRLSIALITWDNQQRERALGVAEALTPDEALTRWFF